VRWASAAPFFVNNFKGRHMSRSQAAEIPSGSWPRRMPVELAAGYCGERTVQAFIERVGKEYPNPRVLDGRRKLWLRDDLDQAIAPGNPGDIAEDL
jgi:hypothetical protein